MKKIIIGILGILLMSQYTIGQINIPMVDSNYVSHIKTVEIRPLGRPVDNPVIPLGKDQLVISFDDLGRNSHYYRYTVIHCDRYWEPSDIDFSEYINGFENVLLARSSFSLSTYQPYRHYEFVFPNKDMKLLISGNYLLVVYEEDSGSILFTRRFQVYENKLKIDFKIVRPVFNNRYRTGQQIELKAYGQNLNIVNPQKNLVAAIAQNGQWYYGAMLPPRNSGGNTFYWNYPDKPVFQGAREFRLMDLRSTDSKKMGIEYIQYLRDTINIYKYIDYPRVGNVSHDLNDLNGQFFIDNEDKRLNPALSSQYVKAHFSLKNPRIDRDIYVIGDLTQWNFIPEARLKYDEEKGVYHTSLFLKQGIYAYLYAVKSETREPDFSIIEGNDFNTENSYQVFIYYKSISDRYDKLIGYLSYPQVRK